MNSVSGKRLGLKTKFTERGRDVEIGGGLQRRLPGAELVGSAPSAIDPKEIEKVKVVMTIMDGRVVYQVKN